jgi:hypothetical protein
MLVFYSRPNHVNRQMLIQSYFSQLSTRSKVDFIQIVLAFQKDSLIIYLLYFLQVDRSQHLALLHRSAMTFLDFADSPLDY